MAQSFMYPHAYNMGLEYNDPIFGEFYNFQWINNLDFIESATIPGYSNPVKLANLFRFSDKLKGVSGNWFNVDASDCTEMFVGCRNLMSEYISLNMVLSQTPITVENMFENCTKLTSFPANFINTLFNNGQMVNCYRMFCNCYNISGEVNTVSFNINILDGYEMFTNCTNISIFSGSSHSMFNYISNAENMFYNCRNLTYVFLGNNLPELVDASHMFANCTKLINVDLNYAPKLLEASYMFYNCRNFNPGAGIYENIFTFNSLDSADHMFHYCDSLTALNICIPNVQDASYMFANCNNLQTLSALHVSNYIHYSEYMFAGCNKLTYNISTIFTSIIKTNLINITNMFQLCKNITGAPTISGFTNLTTARSAFFGAYNLTGTANFINCNNLKSLALTFKGCNCLTGISVSDCNALTDISEMAAWCSNLTTTMLNFGNNLQYMSYAFDNCVNLTTISGWNPNCLRNAADTSYMFNNCGNLTEIQITNLTACEYANNMFSRCYNLTGNINFVRLPNLINGSAMFDECWKLKMVIETNILSKLVNGYQMFFDCYNISGSVNLTNSSLFRDGDWMFCGCSNLTGTINLAGLTSLINAASMFSGCRNLTSIVPTSFDGVTLYSVPNDHLQYTFATCNNITTNALRIFNASRNVQLDPGGIFISAFLYCYNMTDQHLVHDLWK
jgi:hypothetical protein